MSLKNYNRIKSVLAENGKTSKDLAVALNISEVSVSRWCTNKRQPTLPVLFQIAEWLKMDARLLLVDSTANNDRAK